MAIGVRSYSQIKTIKNIIHAYYSMRNGVSEMVDIAVLERKLKQLREQEMDMRKKPINQLGRPGYMRLNGVRHSVMVLSDLIDEAIEGREY